MPKVDLNRNPYESPSAAAPSQTTSADWTRLQRLGFFAASVPAVVCVLVWFTCLAATVASLFTAFNIESIQANFFWQALGKRTIQVALIQVAIYSAWVAVSRELCVKHRLLWVVTLFLLNILAIPVFLWAKYYHKTATILQQRQSADATIQNHSDSQPRDAEISS